MAGYSGTPLVKKLGIKPGQRIALLSGPPGYRKTLGALPEQVKCTARLGEKLDFIQLFATDQADLKRRFKKAKGGLATNGSLWISWPRRAQEWQPTSMRT